MEAKKSKQNKGPAGLLAPVKPAEVPILPDVHVSKVDQLKSKMAKVEA